MAPLTNDGDYGVEPGSPKPFSFNLPEEHRSFPPTPCPQCGQPTTGMDITSFVATAADGTRHGGPSLVSFDDCECVWVALSGKDLHVINTTDGVELGYRAVSGRGQFHER